MTPPAVAARAASQHIGKLAACGAKFLIWPDNTIHQALPYVKAQSGSLA